MAEWRAGNLAAIACDIRQKDGSVGGGNPQFAVVTAKNSAGLYFRSPGGNVGLRRLVAVVRINKYKIQRGISESRGSRNTGHLHRRQPSAAFCLCRIFQKLP